MAFEFVSPYNKIGWKQPRCGIVRHVTSPPLSVARFYLSYVLARHKSGK